ncbi:WD40/YVTN/BNR-like repeat-containing protein [Mongoliibacter ruber]|uniref:Sortilin (Neurotensin receptor 3) n=1 Tax=Mongoliibacter ruber TaxID=1750599 RepID=A0A2T0WVI8_9BACT|nr:sialidase family protein [Mongoliibacter ruber]PRY90687.1 sortilin (neurotensin receptor 3) [Mongoliibacter ruber]
MSFSQSIGNLFLTISISLQMVFCQSPHNNSVNWVQSATGGGGYITGLVQHPVKTDTWFARCDVAGIFVSYDRGKSWVAKNGGLEDWFSHSVRSIAIDPFDADIMMRASGDLRNGSLFGSIHKSSDGGETWNKVNDEMGFFGNGPSRMFGELIVFDPKTEGNVLAAGDSGGIYISQDKGESWKYVFGEQESFAAISISPYLPGNYFAASKNGKLFKSQDSGQNWQLLFENPDWHFTELTFHSQDYKVLIGSFIQTNVSTANDRTSVFGGVAKSVDGGLTFKELKNGLPSGFQYNTIELDESSPNRMFTVPDARPGHSLSNLPIYFTEDGGESWRLKGAYSWEDFSNYPSYIRSLDHIGWAVSKIRLDVSDKGRLLFSNWYGVSVSEDSGVSWDGNHFIGLETSCLENIEVSGGKVYSTLADHNPMVSNDHGATFNSFISGGMPSSTAISFGESESIVYGLRNKQKAGLFEYVDSRPNLIQEFLPKSYVQAIENNPWEKGKFFVLVEGDLNQSAGLYRWDSFKRQIERLNYPLQNEVDFIPVNGDFIEDELLNIVKGQRKNVVGADKLLALDQKREGTIYLGEWTEGIFVSHDNGSSWESRNFGLPIKSDTASVLTVLKAHPQREGTVYAGFIKEGLWRSIDFGVSWEKIYPLDQGVFNVTALDLKEVNDSEVLIIGGEDLFWSRMNPSVLISLDEGRNWKNCYDKSKGALRIKGLALDESLNRAYVATSGNGAFHFDY